MQNWIMNKWWMQFEWINNKCMIEYEWMYMNDWVMNVWMYEWMYNDYIEVNFFLMSVFSTPPFPAILYAKHFLQPLQVLQGTMKLLQFCEEVGIHGLSKI